MEHEGLVGSLDGVFGRTAVGWAWNPHDHSDTPEVEFLAGDEVIAVSRGSNMREDLRAAGFGTGLYGFRIELPLDIMSADSVCITARTRHGELRNSPVRPPKNTLKWMNRTRRLSVRRRRRVQLRLDRATEGQLLSILMPVYNTRPDWLACALDSVLNQWCGRWELICVDDGSTRVDTITLLDSYAARDTRIKVIRAEANGGIAKATNIALHHSRGDYVTFLDHDDYLECDAVFKLLKAAKSSAELIYSDEAITASNINMFLLVAARPAFSYDFYMSHPYFPHMVCVRRDVAVAVGGLDEALPISADVDFVVRVIEQAKTVVHIPAVLYRWRTHESSAGHAQMAKVTATTQSIYQAHYDRMGIEARVSPGPSFNQYRVDYPDPGGRVLIVIPTKDRVDLLRTCLDSLFRTVSADQVKIVVIDHESTDLDTLDYIDAVRDRISVMRYSGPFNFSLMNNRAVDRFGYDCQFVLFLNNDIEAREAGWLERMRSLVGRKDVGAVGATLIYGDDRVQHGGVIIGINGYADHAHRLSPLWINGKRNPGYLQSLVSLRDYAAVTAACMMMRLDVFQAVGRFDERQVIGFNDTDLCLRVFEDGYKILCDPFSVLYHYESATRIKSNDLHHPVDNQRFRQVWRALLRHGDPFYNPQLNLRGLDHTLNTGEVSDSRVGLPRARPVVLPGHAPAPVKL